jgi:hypothetical protein
MFAVDDTLPVSVPDADDARARVGSTAPITISIEISETAELIARRILALLLAFLEASDSDF